MARRKPPTIPGSVLLQKVRATLEKKGWPPGLTVLSGDDLYHLDAAQESLLRSLVPAEETEFALTVYGSGTSRVGVGTALTAARSIGMFSPRRVVLVKDVNALEGEPEPLEEYAAAPPPGSHLIVRADALDRRRKLHKAVASCGTQLRFDVGTGEEARRESAKELRRLAEERHLKLDRDTAVLLLEAFAGDLYRIRAELDKVRSWVGGDDPATVRVEDLKEVAAASAALSGWEIADAVLDREPTDGVAAARRLLASGSEPLLLLGAVASRARAMLQAKAMIEAGRPEGEVLRRVRGAWFHGDRMLRGLRKYSMEELMGFPRRLADADRALKSSTMDPSSVMQELVRGMIGSREETAR
jgi:DNA polymerase-3 subunit delta